MSLTIKDLRKILKGVSGTANISCGNSTAYSPDYNAPNVLNIDLYNRSYDVKDKSKVDTVIFWSPE